ncbi:MAG: hypothetical protein LPD71_09620 [Shewanella sp.]|nr:hypothetical protein [Shewanella sp.]MCF1456361.1 hypothetical protein [Shewanella sp.]
MWNGLTQTELTAEGVDSVNNLAQIDSDIGVTYRGNTCSYVAAHFIQQGKKTLQMEYHNKTGKVSVKNDAYYDKKVIRFLSSIH